MRVAAGIAEQTVCIGMITESCRHRRMTPASWRCWIWSLVTALALATGPASAQDLELQALSLALTNTDQSIDVSGSSLQAYRLPFAFTPRSLDEHRWGLKVHLPVSFGAYDLRASTSVGDFTERIETIGAAPGVEFLLPINERWMVKPFVEVGISASTSGGETEVLYSGGVRFRGDLNVRGALLTAGLSGRYSNDRSQRALLDDYTVIALGADLRWPSRARLGDQPLQVGGYGVVRIFPNLDLPETFESDFGQVYEIGICFTPEETIEIVGLKLDWFGVGYRFGDLFNGVRIGFSFPF